MDFLCAAGISLDFGVRTVTFEDGTSIPFLNDPHTSEMDNKVGENGDAEGDPLCPPQGEAPFSESPLPLSDNLIPSEPDACAQSHPHAVIRIASVVPISGQESAAGKTVGKASTLSNRIGCGTSCMSIYTVLPLAPMTLAKHIWSNILLKQGMPSQSASGLEDCPKPAKLLLIR